MITKFNIGDTVIDNEGIKGKIVSIAIDEYGIKYNIKRNGKEFTLTEYEDKLTKAPIAREEALAAGIKRNDVTLSVYDTLDEAKEAMRNYVEVESISLIEREYYKVSLYRTEKTAVIVFFEQLGAEKQIVTYSI